MSQTLSTEKREKLFKQRLQRVHSTVGISFSLMMFVAVFFGVFAILLPYIQVWEKPSRHYQTPDVTKIDYSAMIDPILQDPEFPKINGVEISLPGYMHDPALKVSTKFVEPIIFNPNTATRVENEGDASQLAWFLNQMHYGGPFKTFGYTIFGFMAVAGMFLVIGGVYQIFKIKYNSRASSTGGKFSKWHRKIFTWLFPPFIIITLTGALMNIGYTGSAPMAYLASQGKTTEVWALAGPVLFPPDPILEKSGKEAEMISINVLIKKAQEVNPNVEYQSITLFNWGDASARAKFEGYNPYKPFLNGISNKPTVILKGVDGSVLSDVRVMNKHWSGLVFDTLYFLHLLFGVDDITRIFMASIMAISAFALGFGTLLWLEKRARKFPMEIPVYNWISKFALTVMVGVIPATALLFFLQWTLPFDMADRFLWHKGLFAVIWMGTLTWSFYRINSYQAAKEFLFLAGVLFILAPIMHFINSGFTPVSLVENNMAKILFVDIALFIVGSFLIFISLKLPTKREEIQNFWKKIL